MALTPYVLYDCLVDDLEHLLEWDSEGNLVDPYLLGDVDRYRAFSLATSFFKKLEDGCEGLEADSYRKFKELNESLESFKITPLNTIDEVLVNEALLNIERFFTTAMDRNRTWWTLDECFVAGTTGPGASIGGLACDFYTKLYASPLVATEPHLHDHYRGSLASNPRRLAAEDHRRTTYGCEVRSSSNLRFVPKNTTSLRTICVEPGLNMFYQLGLGKIIESELRKQFRLDLSVQQFLNRDLARKGSMDDSLCTIDLSSASDSISLELCRKARLPSVFFYLRSKSYAYNGVESPLHMISTMGNGFTFPLETLIFLSCVKAVIQSFGDNFDCMPHRRTWGVFGDDLIVDKKYYHRLVRLLALLGFSVNQEKSFSEGWFRESCGGDYYYGHDVRGVYLRTLRSRASLFSAMNRLIRWSLKTGIKLDRTLGALKKSVPNNFVPLHESDDSGIKIPLRYLYTKRDANRSFLYRAWRPKIPHIYINTVSMRVKGSRGRRFFFNPEGVHLSWLAGRIRNNSISTRANSKSYRYEHRVSPCWDYSLDPEYDRWIQETSLSGIWQGLSWLTPD